MKKLHISKNTVNNNSSELSYISDKQIQLVRHIAEAADEVYEPPKTRETGFYHSIICQVSLPRSRVDGQFFARKIGRASIIIQPGTLVIDGNPTQQIIPYGVFPRLVFARMMTYAIKTRSREIPLGRTPADLLRSLELSIDGRRYRTLYKQTAALAACTIRLGWENTTITPSLFEEFVCWNQEEAIKGKEAAIVLSQQFYTSLLNHAVPLDLRAARCLCGTSLGFDIYTALAYRLTNLNRTTLVSWHALKDQFGQEYRYLRDFKKEFLRLLKRVLLAYPQAKVTVHEKNGLELQPSPPPVPFLLSK